MSSTLPRLYLARHGDTAWTDSRRHTGRTDLPLSERGEDRAGQLGQVLSPIPFAHVFTSPLRRVARTCALAGFGEVARINRELLEWDYGPYEGKTTSEIVRERPGWELFRDGCPGGDRSRTSPTAPTDSSPGCRSWAATCWPFPAGTSSE
jgi:broad specificity phosphatase PhoE